MVAAASEPGRVVTNGMSQYKRAERNANAGIVVGISPEDYPGGPLAGIAFQRHWEERAFVLGGSDYRAPGQLVGDFIARRPSTSLGTVEPSYKPGVTPTDLSTALPDYVIEAIREALPEIDKKLHGFAMHDAVLTGVETRTSSPLRIRRKDDDYQSVNVEGLYPAGEGAGYAGGIYSAAIDGIEVAEAVARPSPAAGAAELRPPEMADPAADSAPAQVAGRSRHRAAGEAGGQQVAPVGPPSRASRRRRTRRAARAASGARPLPRRARRRRC